MDFPNKILSPSSRIGDANHFLSGFERKKCSKKELAEENDENWEHVNNSGTRTGSPKKEEPKMFTSKTVSSTANTNILTERNSASDTFFEINPRSKPSVGLTDFESSRRIITPHSIGTRSPVDNSSLGSHSPSSAPYDPATNYTSPRPEFLRYNPNRKREILSRIEQEMEEELGYGFDSSSSSDTEKLNRKGSSSHSSVSCQLNLHDEEFKIVDEDDSDIEDNEIEDKERYTGLARKLFLLFGVLVSSLCYISSMNSIVDTYSPELGVIGGNLKNTRDWAFPRRAYIETILGFSNVCLHASLSEFTCRIDGNLNEVNDHERKELKGIQHVESLLRSKSNNVNEAENERDEFIEDETLGDAHSVAEGKTGETRYVNDSIAPGRSTFEFGDENGDSDESYYVITDESFQAAPIGIASLNSTVDEEARPDLIRFELDETSLDDQKNEQMNMPANFLVELGRPRYMPYLIFLLTSLSMIIGLSSLYKHFRRCYKISSPASFPFSSPPASEFAGKETKIGSEVFAKAKTADNASDIDVERKRSENPEKGHMDLNGARPPKVELLGEFALTGATSLKTSSVQILQRRGADSSAESQLSQKRSSVRKNTLNESSASAESNTSKSSSVPKTQRKEETRERGDIAKMETTTPLRRSSRLRNRVTSP